MLRPGFLCVAALLAAACDRGVAGTTRPVEVRGLPACKTPYARPIVVRLDRDRSLFEDAFSTHVRVDGPAQLAALVVPRVRMHATVRAGLCTATSVATWDCEAATWLASTTVDLDSRSITAVVTLPAFEAACARK